MRVDRSSVIVGKPNSKRFTSIISSISTVEEVSLDRLIKSGDLLILNYSQSIEEASSLLENFNLTSSFELSSKYCLVKNLDFSSKEKQEIYLKYLEESNILFFFTAYSIDRIYSKALLSRVMLIYPTSTFSYSDLLEHQQLAYSSIKDDFQYSSLSEIKIWFLCKSVIYEILKLSDSYLEHRQELSELLGFLEYPEWFVVDVLHRFISILTLAKYNKDTSSIRLINNLIAKNKISYSFSSLLSFIDCLVLALENR